MDMDMVDMDITMARGLLSLDISPVAMGTMTWLWIWKVDSFKVSLKSSVVIQIVG